MGRIEYWLLAAVGALIAFIAFESVKSTLEPHRDALQVEQAGRARAGVLAELARDSAVGGEPSFAPVTADVHSALLPSRAKAPIRNVAEIRRRIADGAQRTYILDLLASQDSVLFRWPDSH